MKTFITTLIFLGLSIYGYSQVSISGTILDTENNKLFGVEIYAPELHIGTTSDLNGEFNLKNLPHGEIDINFSFIGYESIVKTFNIHEDINNIQIVLKESVFNIDEVIISTPFNRLQSENVMKVEHASIKEMKSKGAVNLMEGVASIAGVSQVSTGTSIGKPVIRGLSGNRVLVYAQGVRLENQQFGDEHGLGLNQSGIESVEVIKGPASLLYGSDALGGVIYFNPERFASENTFSSDVSQQYFSNTQGSSTNFGLKQSEEQWKYLVRGSYDTHQDYKIPDGDQVTNSRFNELNFNTGLGFTNELFSSELRYNYTQSNIGLTEGVFEQSESRITDVPFQKLNNHILSLQNHIYFDTSKLDINIGYIHNDRNEFEEGHDDHDEHEEHEDDDDHEEHEDGHDEDDHDEHDQHDMEAALQMKLNTFNYDVQYHFQQFETIELIAGIQGMRQTNTNYGEELLIPNAKVNDIGAFLTSTIDFNNSSLLGGIRFDNRQLETEYHEVIHEDEIHVFDALDKNYNSFTMSLGYKFNLFEKLTTRINLASGFRSPNLAELTSNGVHHGTNRFEIGNPDLENEQNFQTDISLEYQNEHFEFFINGFYNLVNDYIYLTPTGEVIDEAPAFEYIQDNAKLYGGEIGLHLHPHPLDWLHLESSFETVTGKQDDNYLPLIPANKWNNTFRTEFNINKWFKNGFTTLSAGTYFEQNNVSNFETTTSGYTLINLGLGGQVHLSKIKFDLTANLNNAFNKNYIAHLSRLKNMGIPNIGRNFIVGVKFNI